jgi:hypothetical protein
MRTVIATQLSLQTGEHWHSSERSASAQNFIYCEFPMPSSLSAKPNGYHWDNSDATLRLGRRMGARLYFGAGARDCGELVFRAPTPDLPNLRDSRLETMLSFPRFRAVATASPTGTSFSIIVSGAWRHGVAQVPAVVPESDPSIGHLSPHRDVTVLLSSHQTGRELRSYQSALAIMRSGCATAMVRVLSN